LNRVNPESVPGYGEYRVVGNSGQQTLVIKLKPDSAVLGELFNEKAASLAERIFAGICGAVVPVLGVAQYYTTYTKVPTPWQEMALLTLGIGSVAGLANRRIDHAFVNGLFFSGASLAVLRLADIKSGDLWNKALRQYERGSKHLQNYKMFCKAQDVCKNTTETVSNAWNSVYEQMKEGFPLGGVSGSKVVEVKMLGSVVGIAAAGVVTTGSANIDNVVKNVAENAVVKSEVVNDAATTDAVVNNDVANVVIHDIEDRVQVDADAAVRAEADVKAKADADAKAQAEADVKVKADADAKAQAEANAQFEEDVETKVQAEPSWSLGNWDPRIWMGYAPKADADAKAQAEADVKPEANAEAHAQVEANAQLEADAETKIQAEADVKPEAKAQAEADVETTVQAEPSWPLGNLDPRTWIRYTPKDVHFSREPGWGWIGLKPRSKQ
jgi:hypothetical protein